MKLSKKLATATLLSIATQAHAIDRVMYVAPCATLNEDDRVSILQSGSLGDYNAGFCDVAENCVSTGTPQGDGTYKWTQSMPLSNVIDAHGGSLNVTAFTWEKDAYVEVPVTLVKTNSEQKQHIKTIWDSIPEIEVNGFKMPERLSVSSAYCYIPS